MIPTDNLSPKPALTPMCDIDIVVVDNPGWVWDGGYFGLGYRYR